jgi:adenine-specific DNA-methyltransferase
MARSPKPPKPPTKAPAKEPKGYRHKEEAAARPEVGAAPRFKAKKEAATYRYDSSLSPALDWDEQPARDIAAWLLKQIEEAASLPGQSASAWRW